ncbi:MAG: Crp/Fnr family transcriptional regulator [Saprospiraceae bacterium]|nr:Crp/Fnr family transcriptional regulator [Saprospiraceae bacterium]MCB0541955.1 Crp/Fnr family transcriptional regulator [Saprospiraceae bacterium]MCB0574099.1 Crp/Fnr family transcriptional regulator [Saprospiraceae bacterium]MCB9305382.1 Crp/Fnr family transcriptional regulator [Lewinellaceae bacterium]MCB9355977.1 Crp/Fnr family transcriptional regulator [Lewinellaceae bacterium]
MESKKLADASLLRQLAAESGTSVLPAGQVILNFHTYIRNIPIVLRGHVKVVGEDDDGNEILLYYLEPGDSCVMSILGAMNSSTSKVKAITVDETEIVFIRPERAAALIREHPGWAEYIFKLYQSRFEELLQVVTKVNFKKLDDRILDLLEEKARLFDTRLLSVTHQEIAGEIGSPREAVSRVLKKLENEGAVRLFRGKIELV